MSGNSGFKDEVQAMMSTVIEELLTFVAEAGELKTIDDAGFEILVKFYLTLEKIFVVSEGSQIFTLLNRIGEICKRLRGVKDTKILRIS